MKKLISIIISLIMIVGLFPVSALATNSEDNEYAATGEYSDHTLTVEELSGSSAVNKPGAFIEPVQETSTATFVDNSFSASTFSTSVPPEYTNSLDSAAAALRSGMVSRNGAITVNIQIDVAEFDGTEAAAVNLAYNIFEHSLEHTSVSTEGDYLRWVIGSYYYDIVYTLSGNTYLLDITYNLTYYTTAEQEAVLTSAVSELSTQLRLNDNISDYQKIVNIYTYMCDNIQYDYAHLGTPSYTLQFTAYAALINKTAVCQGYALLFYRLALEAGIDARVIVGNAFNGAATERHAWNIVELDDRYYLLDSTWDANTFYYSYFLKSNNDFTDHYADPVYCTDSFTSAYPISTSSYAAPGNGTYIEGAFEYEVFNGYATIIKYTGTSSTVTVPATLGGYPVRGIGYEAFYRVSKMKSLIISEGIIYLSSCAIVSCPSLRTISIPSTLKLTSSTNSSMVSGLGVMPLYCTSLEKYILAADNPYATVYDGALYSKDMTLLLGLPTADPRKVFTVPDGVLSIESDACSYNANLEEVVLPDTVKTIGYWAFDNCSNLAKINIPKNCETIGQYALSRTALTSIHIPAATTVIVTGFGEHCYLETITVDENNPVFYAEDNVLYYKCDDTWALIKHPPTSTKTSFVIPNGVTTIGWYAFDGVTNLNQLVLPASLTYIGDVAFANCANWGRLIFLGNAPEISPSGYTYAKYYFPAGNSTWQKYTEKPGGIPWISGLPTEWVKSGNSWYYINGDAGLAVGWLKIDSKWYFFNEDGIMQTGWQYIEGKWYYFNKGGSMVTGWLKLGDHWYFFNKGGSMATGWVSAGGKWYYMHPSGAMATGLQQVGSATYYFNSSGVMQTGWLKLDGKWFFFKDSGAMAISWQYIDGKWYFFNNSGIMQTGWHCLGSKWYFFNKGGSMATGWVHDGDYWYYTDANGVMVTGTHIIDGQTYTFNNSGVWIA